jgi:hypothetical protein
MARAHEAARHGQYRGEAPVYEEMECVAACGGEGESVTLQKRQKCCPRSLYLWYLGAACGVHPK